MLPESHHKLLAHIRKTQERAKCKRKEAEKKGSDSDEGSDDEFKSVKATVERFVGCTFLIKLFKQQSILPSDYKHKRKTSLLSQRQVLPHAAETCSFVFPFPLLSFSFPSLPSSTVFLISVPHPTSSPLLTTWRW